MSSRIHQLIESATKRGVDCVAVMPGANMLYLTGLPFHLMERATVAFFLAHGQPALVLPTLEATKPASGPVKIDWQPFPWSDEEGPVRAFAAASKALTLSGKTLAVEELVMRVRELRLIEASAPGVRFADAGPLLAACECAEMRSKSRTCGRPSLSPRRRDTDLDHSSGPPDLANVGNSAPSGSGG